MQSSATVVIATPQDQQTVWVWGDEYKFIITSEQTGGSYALWEEWANPGSGTPPHIHHKEHEVFYILEGEMTFFKDGQAVKAGPGTLVHVPSGVVHNYLNQTDQIVHMMVMVTPGGFEQLLLAISDPIIAGQSAPAVTPEKIETLTRLAPVYHMEVVNADAQPA
ncbi:MAG: cupin domain-containing protein [Anaerolineae bacterium]|nr:cupin domain-containing protein [Anaerolineae bacterium]